MKIMNRRQFLANSGAVATLAATPGTTYAQFVGTGAPFNDYRALVCVFLFGGNDSFNMVVPRSDAEYGVYANARNELAVAQADLLAIDPLISDGVQYGLHPSMASLKQLFDTESAAIVANIGPLVEPTTKDQFFDKSVTLPPQLFSHNDQQDQWLTLKGNRTSKTGWAGRIADMIRGSVANQQMATNASLFGTNTFQVADETIAYVMGPDGPQEFAYMSSDPAAGIFYEQGLAFGRIVDAQYNSVYERGFAAVQRRSIDSAETVRAAIDSAEASAVTPYFPQEGPMRSQLMIQLETVAKLIAARSQLQMDRQIFFVAAGGFDTHDNQEQDQPGLLADISESMAAFYNATVGISIADSVTTFTQSDFGRTLTSNGDGSDHAWGGNQLVLGGGVKGRHIYGDYPLLQIGGDDDVGGGRMIPTTSADQYAATLAKWFGIPDVDLDLVAPHIDNFMQRDLGFMV